MSDKKYTSREVAILVLKKAESLAKASLGGLKPTAITPVQGVVSPGQKNAASPMKVGSQAVVKTPKAKAMGQATDKTSVFFGKNDNKKSTSIENLRSFLEQSGKKRQGLTNLK